MKRTYRKLIRRGLRGSLTRFISILAIVAVGSGFLTGLLATTPDMQDTAEKYFDDYALFDIDLRGTMGMTEADVSALSALDTVDQVMPAYVTDLNMESAAGSFVTRIYGVPLSDHGTGRLLNDFELVEGRMPENEGECLVAAPNGLIQASHIGETFRISEDNKDLDSLEDTYAFTELKAVGVVRTPYYMSLESEPSTVGTGSVSLVMFVFPECYSLEVYTDIFLTVQGARELGTFTGAYTEKMNEVTAQLEDFGIERCQIRYQEIRDEASEALEEAQADFDQAKADAEAELADARAELDEGWADLAEGRQELDNSRRELAAAAAELEQAAWDLEDGRQSMRNVRAQLEQTEAEIRAQAESARAELAAMESTMPPEQYAAALEQINAGEREGLEAIALRYQEVEAAEAGLDAAEAELRRGQAELSAGQARIADGEQELADGQAELEQGEKDYAEGKAEAETELADAQKELDEARAELEDLEQPEWYVSGRSDTVSYSSYKSNSEKVAAIARVFPVFFFLVAALVALTTMTRMVEEERGQIGTLKALGYSNGKIALYYLGYSVTASLVGAVIGSAIGFYLLPLVISNAYSILYTLPRVLLSFRWNYVLLIVPLSVGCTTLATLAACVNELREKPAALMLPKAPKAGKRVFLEYIGPLWRHFRFTQKVTARNIFRYKKRLYMTVLGIAGCTALLVTGFGLRDSIHDIVDKQFGEIYRYNLSMYIKDEGAAESDPILRDFLDSGAVNSYALFHTESGQVRFGGASEKVSIQVPQNTAELKQQLTLRERKSGADIPFEEDSLVLTEKTCERLGVKAGEQVTLENADGRKCQLTVSAITENYVAGYAFLSESSYRAAFHSLPAYKLVLAQAADESPEAREAATKQVLQSDQVLLVQFSQSIRESFENTVRSIDYIVIVLILSAGLLAIVVLYNLTNINISERKKELATVKVLGFHEREVAAYIYRETTVLCILGILAGFLLGVWLHSFVVKTAEVDAVMFGRSIQWHSFLFSAVVTAFFTALVDVIMLKKLRKIDMVESMKANE